VQANVAAGVAQRPRQQEGGAAAPATAPAAGAGAQQPQRPGAPGGGALRQPLFSGDHVLETVAAGQVYLHPGAEGPSIRAVQQFLMAQGLELGPAGADGQWGPRTTSALKAWQATHGVPATGVFGHLTLAAMDQEPAVTSAPTTPRPVADRPAGPRRAPTNPQGPEGGTQAQREGGNRPAQGAPGSKNGGLPDDFQKVWDAHPHNYQQDGKKNTSSGDLLAQQGFSPDAYSNTCAIRLSVMLNKLGGDMVITREKAKAAGIDPGRVPFSKKTGWFYLLSAKEMWTYLSKFAGPPSMEWPEGGRFKGEGDFKSAFNNKIEPVVSGKRGIVAFDKIFGFSGTGHVDLFDGKHLSDSPNWYPCQSLKVWYI
jgi:peptidoglycan hydrolase-like protein with peptidoglycan-binding domain